MTVKAVIGTIKSAKECIKYLNELANAEQGGQSEDYLLEASGLLSEYIEVLEQMEVQR